MAEDGSGGCGGDQMRDEICFPNGAGATVESKDLHSGVDTALVGDVSGKRSAPPWINVSRCDDPGRPRLLNNTMSN